MPETKIGASPICTRVRSQNIQFHLTTPFIQVVKQKDGRVCIIIIIKFLLSDPSPACSQFFLPASDSSRSLRASRHAAPNLCSTHNSGVIATVIPASKTNVYSAVRASIIGCTTATPAAPIRHLIRLFTAVALALAPGYKSMTKALLMVKIPVEQKAMKYCNMMGTARWVRRETP